MHPGKQRKCNPFEPVYLRKSGENLKKISGSVSGKLQNVEAHEK